jgi:hypothetical protein
VLSTYSWLYSLCGHWPLFQFLNLYTVDRTPWTGDQPVARTLHTHRTTQTQNKHIQTSMPRVGFEHTIPVFERAIAFHDLDRTATVISKICTMHMKIVNYKTQLLFVHFCLPGFQCARVSTFWAICFPTSPIYSTSGNILPEFTTSHPRRA